MVCLVTTHTEFYSGLVPSEPSRKVSVDGFVVSFYRVRDGALQKYKLFKPNSLGTF